MSVWKKLMTALKGGVNEAAEAVVDSNALRILEQEMREAKEELRRSDQSLTQIMAKRKLSQQKIDGLNASINEYEGHARSASEKGEQSIALECAQKVVELRSDLETEQSFLDKFVSSEKVLRSNIDKAKSNLRRMEQQLDVVKATEQVQKAQSAVSSRYSGANGKMKTAAESLNRIQEKQRQQQAELESAQELAEAEGGGDLDKRLAEAGITSSANNASDELARILGK